MRYPSFFQNSITTASVWALTVVGGLLATPALATQSQESHRPMQLAQSRPTLNDREPSAAPLVGIAIATGAAVLGSKAIQSSRSNGKSQPFSTSSAVGFDQASRSLQRKLMTLVHDDQKVANRLLYQTKLHHPERSIDWCAEKVIYDLKRDRH
ncbi:hypothetical protein [Myxacorys almedinensis]|uniref:Uncharacterized protein n=1 Tax=Myxacorys almedinensis A TaxID=2690445 RepID=A0A8J8CI01_9CYAN|nr:hypothetical protein [Myxacorys almedinensis]NDJ17238.1 hypothetical protein [Myxacorys almedinensis A]